MAGRFHIRADAAAWFKNVIDNVDSRAPLFEAFYLCVLSGLAANRPQDATTANTRELVEHFPADFSTRGHLIVGLFLTREIKGRRIRLEDKASLHRAIREFVDPNSPSRLSELGVNQLNRYGYGGFDQLLEWFEDKPADLESFLPMFHAKINALLGSRPEVAK